MDFYWRLNFGHLPLTKYSKLSYMIERSRLKNGKNDRPQWEKIWKIDRS